jgi:hypothetical protein
MDRRRKKARKSGTARPVTIPAGQPDGECKVLPFARVVHHDVYQAKEPVYGNVLADPIDQQFMEESPDVAVLCVPEYSKREPGHDRRSFFVAGWVKTMLLIGTFTAWTAAAIALSIALG